MSLITQCPACATMFRVVPDQLRISEGWVRCGQCDEVFDANAHLRTLHEAATPIVLDQQPSIPPADEALAPLEPEAPARLEEVPAPEEEYDWSPMLAPQVSAASVSASLESRAPASAWDPVAIQDDVLQLELPEPLDAGEAVESKPELDAFLQKNPHDLPEDETAGEKALAPELEHAWLHAAPAAPAIAHDELPQAPLVEDRAPPSFMAGSKSPPTAGRWMGKKVLVSLTVLLALGLVLQFLLHERDHIAATAPALRPVLVAACETVSCVVSAPQQIESIAIESSAFTSLKPGVYVLNLTLKNAATTDLAVPALELTLTDMQDHPMLRRVILPTEFYGKPQMAAGAELSAHLPLSVLAGVTAEKIAGYKLLAFYP